MTAEEETRLARALEVIELVDVLVASLHAERRSDERPPGDVELSVAIDAETFDENDRLKVILKVNVDLPDVLIDVAIEGRYVFSDPVELDRDLIASLINSRALGDLYPFARENIRSCTQRLDVDRITLPLRLLGRAEAKD